MPDSGARLRSRKIYSALRMPPFASNVMKAAREGKKLAKWRRKPKDITQNKSLLLKLPAELRNEIWRYALPEEVQLTKASPIPILPGITRACRQTLRETFGIFVFETKWRLIVDDYAGGHELDGVRRQRALEKLATKLSGLTFAHLPYSMAHVEFHGMPNWVNLLEWCKTIHAFERSFCKFTTKPLDQLLDATLEWHDAEFAKMAWNFANENKARPWEEVEKDLEIMHKIMAMKDGLWA